MVWSLTPLKTLNSPCPEILGPSRWQPKMDPFTNIRADITATRLTISARRCLTRLASSQRVSHSHLCHIMKWHTYDCLFDILTLPHAVSFLKRKSGTQQITAQNQAPCPLLCHMHKLTFRRKLQLIVCSHTSNSKNFRTNKNPLASQLAIKRHLRNYNNKTIVLTSYLAIYLSPLRCPDLSASFPDNGYLRNQCESCKRVSGDDHSWD